MAVIGKGSFLWILIALLASSPWGGEDKILSAPGGRFVFGQISEYRRDQYLLDTQTGRLWYVVQMQDSLLALRPLPYGGYELKGKKVHRVLSDLPLQAEVIHTPLEEPPNPSDEKEQERRLRWVSDSLAMTRDCVGEMAKDDVCKDFFRKIGKAP